MKEKLVKFVKENKIKVVIGVVVIVLLASFGAAYGLGAFKTPEPTQEPKQTEVKQDSKQDKNTSAKEDKKNDSKKHEDKKSDSKETPTKTDNTDSTTSNTTVAPTENTSTTTNNTSTSNNTSNSTPAPTPCVPTYTTVNHPEQGHYEQREVMPAHDEAIYEERPVGTTTGHIYDSIEDFRSQAYSNNPVDSGCSFQRVQVGTQHYDAEYEQVWVVDQPAYTTTEASGC